MKKLILLSILSVSFTMLSAQDRWSFALQSSIGLNGNTDLFETTNPIDIGSSYYATENKVSINGSIGGEASWRFREQLHIKGGITLLALNRQYNEIVSRKLPDGTENFFYAADYHWQNYWLTALLSFQYFIGESSQQWRPFLEVGATNNYLVRQTAERNFITIDQRTEFFEGSDRNTTDLIQDAATINRWNTNMLLGAGLQWQKWTLSIQYIGQFRRHDRADYYYGPEYICDSPDCPVRATRFRLPQRLQVQLGYLLF